MKKLLKLSMLSTGLMTLGIMASSGVNAQGACSVAYDTVNTWGNGGQYKVTVTNTSAAKTSWELCWTFAGSDVIPNLWDGVLTQTGNNVCVKNAPYNPNLPANGTATFGFLVNNPGTIPTAFTLNGAACGGNASSASSTPSSVPTTSSSRSSSSAPSVAARWLLDATNSTFNFVTVKKSTAGVETPESMTFTQLQGTVSTTGQATLTIPLASISTNNVVRDPRMQSLLFETAYLPSLHFTTQLDLAAIDAMAAGSTSVQSITGNLVLHGIVKSVVFDALVVKHANNSVSFSPRKPIVINSVDFDLNAGVEALRAAASLSTIGEKVPVYFKMFLNRDNPTNVPAISLAAAPNAAISLSGTVSNATGAANLNWADASSNETGFLVRRKGADGRWTTATGTAANAVSYLDNLTATGSYDYKVISYTDSIPASATAPLTLVYAGVGSSTSSVSSASSTSVTSVSSSSRSASSLSSGSSSSTGALVGDVTRGASLWTQRSCVGCHGVDGAKNANGSAAIIQLNPNRSFYRHRNDTQDRSLREFISLWMPQGGEGTCTGQCAADLEAYIWTFRKPSDGQPDVPVSYFSCPSNAPSYGQRTLRLLTKLEYQRSVRDLVNYQADVTASLPDDFVSGAFVNNNTLSVDKTRYTSYLANAERIATDVATRWNAVLNCTPSTSCASTLVNTLGPRIFRRPLTTEEQTAYLAVANGTTGGRTATDGMQVALTAMLSSPQFLYRSEVGTLSSSGVYKLDGYEMATYMAYTFTGTTPNATLLTAAGNGTLNTVTGIRAQAATLLSSANTKLLLTDLVNRWLLTEKIETLTKPAVSNFAALGADMKNELGKNFSYAMLETNGSFANIYNPSYTHVNQRLATHYGVSFSGTQDADGFVRATTADRGGILTSGAFLSRYASTTDSNMITRAVAIRRKLLCQDIPEPPSGVSLDREQLFAQDREFYENPHTTQRMIFDRLTGGTTCSNCHGEIINPLGGGLENFDTAGRIRSTDLKGNPIVSSGTFYSPYPQLQFLNDPDRVRYSPEIQFNGAKDLARTIVEHPQVANLAQTCLATQFVSYSSGINSIFLIDSDREVGYKRISKDEENAYRCDVADLTNVLTTRGPRAMLEEIPALESVMYRKEWAR
uniref:Putative cbp2D carbohydrate binding protein n=1 Tax=uncultured organism TaxID=155900 RepID=D8VN75_9ZZZZ|nr:putative cbp2D carbohydrate binding protein [uncultured organism]